MLQIDVIMSSWTVALSPVFQWIRSTILSNPILPSTCHHTTLSNYINISAWLFGLSLACASHSLVTIVRTIFAKRIDFFASVFDGIERRKKWLLNLKQGKSDLPICEGPIKKWDNCFEMTRTDCGDHIGEWRGGKKYGKGSTKGSFGESFDGRYLNDWDANGVVDYPNGSRFSGDLKITCKFDPNGQGIYRWRNGDTVSGSWVDGYLEGFATVRYVKDPRFKHDTFANQYVGGVPIFNTKSCLQQSEGKIIENLGVPEKTYEADGKKYLSYKIYDDYNFQKKSDYQYTCTASFDTVFTVVSGKVVSARDSTLKFGSKFNECTGVFDFSNIYLERYGCYK